MSRSAADATRFTATSPHAYSNPVRSSPSNPPIPPRRGPPIAPNSANASLKGETPQEKVARLRAARLAARLGEISTWDRIVVGGRVWADRAHRVTIMGLMGFTVLSGGVSIVALTDMIIYNRRKRRQYYAEQTALFHQNLSAAIAADRAGLPLTEDQTLLLNRARARMEAEERAKAKKAGGWRRWIFGGLSDSSDKVALDTATEGSDGKGVPTPTQPEAGSIFKDPEEKPNKTLHAIEEKRREGEKSLEAAGAPGGPLDQLAEEAGREAGRAKGGWTSWMTRRE